MKNSCNFLPLCLLLAGTIVKAQVGINTDNPKSTMEIRELRTNAVNEIITSDGIIIPTLSKKELALKENSVYSSLNIGVKVYVNDISGVINGPSIGQVININEKGFYYFSERLIWEKLVSDSTEDAWINNPNENRIELGTNSLGNERMSNSNVIITDNGFLGINSINPTKRLDINAATANNSTDYIKISNLKEIPSTDIINTLIIDNNGNIYKNDVENLNGQIMRIPIIGFRKGGDNANERQGSLRLSFDDGPISPACVNICNKNFINNIKGVTNNELLSNQILTNGTGTNIRITERIILPKGTFKIQVRLVGHYNTPFTPAPTPQPSGTAYNAGTSILKLAIGNNEFSLTNYHESTYGNDALTSILYTEFIVLEEDDPEKRTLDFLFDPVVRDFTIIPSSTVNGNTVNKSLVLIERIR
ncbi:MAG TPA: hypothetical protein VIG94_05655 [Faecalibacter sp.]